MEISLEREKRLKQIFGIFVSIGVIHEGREEGKGRG